MLFALSNLKKIVSKILFERVLKIFEASLNVIRGVLASNFYSIASGDFL